MNGRFPARLRRRLSFGRTQQALDGLATPERGGLAKPATGGGFGGETFRAVRNNRNFRLFYFGQAISLSGTWMQTIAQAWLVLQLTNSKIALGTVTLLQFLPITIFVLFAGVLWLLVTRRAKQPATVQGIWAGTVVGIALGGILSLLSRGPLP